MTELNEDLNGNFHVVADWFQNRTTLSVARRRLCSMLDTSVMPASAYRRQRQAGTYDRRLDHCLLISAAGEQG